MSGVIATIPRYQFSSSTGKPLANGTLTVYVAGSTTPTNTWQDAALSTLNTNPIQLDARGECVLWLDPAVQYKFVLKNSAGAIQWTQDNISGAGTLADQLRTDLAASSGSSLVGHMPAGTGAVTTTLQAKLRESVSVTDNGAVGNGVTDNSTAIINSKAVKGTAFVPDGSFLVSESSDLGKLWGPGTFVQGGIQKYLPGSIHSGAKNDTTPLLVDLHYGVLRGTPFATAEVFSGTGYSIAADVAAGATSFTSSGAVPVAGQLIQYLGKDGYRHSAVATAVAGAVVTLDQPVIAGIAAGSASALNISAFYANNGPHPNVYGYQAIVDYVVQNGVKAYGNVFYQVPQALGAGNVSASSGNNVLKPGGATYPAYQVTPSGTSGCQFNFRPIKTGSHVLRIKVNTQGANLVVIWSCVTAGGTLSSATTVNTKVPTLIEIPIWVQKNNSDQGINVTFASATNTVFFIARGEFCEYTEASALALNCGKHVLLGDSWFAQTGISEQMAMRLPNAIIVNKGVGGNTASDLINRFDTDVKPESPDFVWVMTGTNDAGSSFSPDLFSFYIQKLKSKIQAIGATPIFFGPSVGTTLATTFDYSRQYADKVPYIDANLHDDYGTWIPVDAGFTKVGSPTFTGIFVKSGGICTCTLLVTGNGGSSASVAGTSSITGLPFTPLVNSVCFASNGSISSLGTGLVFAASGTVYVPAWAADTGTVTVSFSYQVK